MDYTLAVIKPNIIETNQVGEVLRLMEYWGFQIVDMKYIPSAELKFVRKFYEVHKHKSFYNRLINGMSNRPWLAIKLTHSTSTDVINHWRTWLKEIRKEYSGAELHDNAVHGSDSVESAQKELDLIFRNDGFLHFTHGGTYHKIKKEDISTITLTGIKSCVGMANGQEIKVSSKIGNYIAQKLDEKLYD